MGGLGEGIEGKAHAKDYILSLLPVPYPYGSLTHGGNKRSYYAQYGIHADCGEVIHERIRPRVGVARLRSGIGKEYRPAEHAAQHAAETAHARAEGKAFGEEARKAEHREGKKLIQHELNGMHNVCALHNLQKAIRKARQQAGCGAVHPREHEYGQHGEQRYAAAHGH